jgi:hypothetical protein
MVEKRKHMLNRKKPLEYEQLEDGSYAVQWGKKKILVDEDDFHLFEDFYHSSTVNRARNSKGKTIMTRTIIMYPNRVRGRRRPNFYLHHLIMDAPQYYHVIHLDNNQFNCRKANLRVLVPDSRHDWTKDIR